MGITHFTDGETEPQEASHLASWQQTWAGFQLRPFAKNLCSTAVSPDAEKREAWEVKD
jgi:hypothetical protein